jgi:hypothetical protein
MATKVVMRVVPGGLMAVNRAEESKFDDLIGREVQASISQPRNLKFHRKFFAMLHLAREMADLDVNAEQFRHLVLVGAGYCTFHEIGGRVIAIPKSMSFGSMDETEFSKLYSDCLDFICANYVDETPGRLDAMLHFM